MSGDDKRPGGYITLEAARRREDARVRKGALEALREIRRSLGKPDHYAAIERVLKRARWKAAT